MDGVMSVALFDLCFYFGKGGLLVYVILQFKIFKISLQIKYISHIPGFGKLGIEFEKNERARWFEYL